MKIIYKLNNQIKNYEWGSPNLIPQFLGMENYKRMPYAEMWMGTHSGAPSRIDSGTNELNPDEKKYLKELSGELPFLFKLIAVEKQLSIQAHPNKEQAAEGYRQEEEAGLALNAPRRNYKDTNHKPEILCAVSPFTLMAGLREHEQIKSSLESLTLMFPQLKEIIAPLIKAINTGSLAVFFRILFNMTNLEREYINNLILEKENLENMGIISCEQWKLVREFASQYPGDPAILTPLYLNLITLKPGEAIYVPPGILHSYSKGFGVELMAASDNVLRSGLTPKYIDIPQLMRIVDYKPYMPEIITSDSSSWFCYQTPCREFILALMRTGAGGGTENIFPAKGPAICIVTEGELAAGGAKIKKGESFYIPANGEEPVVLKGNYSLFAAITADAV
jgi:mannose-6-phosphate isomerase